ncbi:hypothetical protein GmHk_14G040830 [Glycine max]|nr:hypothetical protein GmHk_14G040830 [Glycine max]
MKAELLAIYHGLKTAWNEGFRKFFNEPQSHWHPYATILNRMFKAFTHEYWQLSFSHTFREVNHCADWLTRQGNPWVTWNVYPPKIRLLPLADSHGVSFVRS